MPTYQTTPYISWTFPDQAIAMNRKGVQPLQSTPLPSQSMEVGGQKYGWAEDARKMALARLETNRTKDKGMRGLINTTERSQAFDRPAHLSQTRINGKFMDPSYQFTQTPSGLRGGTGLLTKEGRAWAKRKLQQRVQELNAIDSQNYSAGPPSKIVILPELYKVDTNIAKLLNRVYSGTYNVDILEALDDLVVSILSASSSMTAPDVSRYTNALNPLAESVERTLEPSNSGNVDSQTRSVLTLALRRIKQINKLMIEIADASDLPETARVKVLQNIAKKMAEKVSSSKPPTVVLKKRRLRVQDDSSGMDMRSFFQVPPGMSGRPPSTTTTTTNRVPSSQEISNAPQSNVGIRPAFDWTAYWNSTPDQQQRMLDEYRNQ